MADRDLLDAKVESIERCLRRIEERTPATPEELETDYDAQDIISVNLQRAVQLSVDIASYLITARGWPAPDTMGGASIASSPSASEISATMSDVWLKRGSVDPSHASERQPKPEDRI